MLRLSPWRDTQASGNYPDDIARLIA